MKRTNIQRKLSNEFRNLYVPHQNNRQISLCHVICTKEQKALEHSRFLAQCQVRGCRMSTSMADRQHCAQRSVSKYPSAPGNRLGSYLDMQDHPPSKQILHNSACNVPKFSLNRKFVPNHLQNITRVEPVSMLRNEVLKLLKYACLCLRHFYSGNEMVEVKEGLMHPDVKIYSLRSDCTVTFADISRNLK